MMDIQKRLRLDGSVAVVTGGAGGIGNATSTALAELGATVIVADLDAHGAEQVANSIVAQGGRAKALQVDVTSEAAVEAFFEAVIDREGRIDILVNNAGIAIRHPATELTLADWDKVISVNITAGFLCARVAARAMIEAGSGGTIVNVSSIMGLSGGGLYPNISYQTSKGAVVNMTRALAIEWASDGIRVNAVAPTYVRTNLIAGLLENPDLVAKIEDMTPLGRLAEPEEVAAAICFLASPAAAMVTGHVLPIDGGFLAQ